MKWGFASANQSITGPEHRLFGSEAHLGGVRIPPPTSVGGGESGPSGLERRPWPSDSPDYLTPLFGGGVGSVYEGFGPRRRRHDQRLRPTACRTVGGFGQRQCTVQSAASAGERANRITDSFGGRRCERRHGPRPAMAHWSQPRLRGLATLDSSSRSGQGECAAMSGGQRPQ